MPLGNWANSYLGVPGGTNPIDICMIHGEANIENNAVSIDANMDAIMYEIEAGRFPILALDLPEIGKIFLPLIGFTQMAIEFFAIYLDDTVGGGALLTVGVLVNEMGARILIAPLY